MMTLSFKVRQSFVFYDPVYKASLNIIMTLTDRWCLFAFPHQGGGCGLMTRNRKFEQIIKGMNHVSLGVLTRFSWMRCLVEFRILGGKFNFLSS